MLGDVRENEHGAGQGGESVDAVRWPKWGQNDQRRRKASCAGIRDSALILGAIEGSGGTRMSRTLVPSSSREHQWGFCTKPGKRVGTETSKE